MQCGSQVYAGRREATSSSKPLVFRGIELPGATVCRRILCFRLRDEWWFFATDVAGDCTVGDDSAMSPSLPHEMMAVQCP